MERTLIANSSSIAEVGYDSGFHVLEVLFVGGNVYRYFDVPEEVVADFMSPWTGSIGRYFEANIRFQYPYEQL